jgi:hypothetical protein
MNRHSLKRPSSQTAFGVPAANRRKLDMPLETVLNDLDGATHTRQDKNVLETFEEEPHTISLAAFLLATIISTSEGILDSRYEKTQNAKALLRTRPELLEKVREAWNEKTFKEIRNLSTIKPIHR